MSVTFDTSHPLISPLNADAPLNMPLILVMPVTFQPLRLLLSELAPENICAKDDTPLRFGASAALSSIYIAPENALSMLVHWISPHCSILMSLWDTSSPYDPS